MLGLLCRLHRLHIQLVLQAETKERIVFPRVLKHEHKASKSIANDWTLSEITDDDIYKAVKTAQAEAKLVVEELGMANLYIKHCMTLGNKKIPDIDSGTTEQSTLDDDDEDDNDDDIYDEEISVADSGETCSEEESAIASDLEKLSEYHLIDSRML